MLRARLITGLLYIGFVFWAIFSLSAPAFVVASGVLSCFLIAEWLKLVRVGNQWWRILWVDIFIICLFAMVWWSPKIPYTLYASALFWLLATIVLIVLQIIQRKPNPCKYFLVTLGFILLIPMFEGLRAIRYWDNGQWYVLMMFLLLWSFDTFAYVSGHALRGPKLAPLISPGKTWAGLFGGGILTVATLLLYRLFVMEAGMPTLSWYLCILTLVVVATVGDLLESLIKRMHDVKDSGRVLPGHGGFLDRFDSMIAVAPVFMLMLAQGWL